MKAAMMLTTETADALAMARRLRAGMPEADWTAFVRDDDRETLLPALIGCRICSDKPRGSKQKFLRDLRAQRFEVVFVAWHGGERPQPLKLVAMCMGAKDVVVCDVGGRSFSVRWWAPWTWAEHALRRLGQLRVLRALRVCASLYRATLGRVVEALALVPEMLRSRRLPKPGR